MSNRTHLVVMPGDGIGPEITAATLHVAREVDRLLSLGLTFEEAPIGFEALKKHGTTFPDSSFEAGKRADGVILGPVVWEALGPTVSFPSSFGEGRRGRLYVASLGADRVYKLVAP